jgi:hypothetical protein
VTGRKERRGVTRHPFSGWRHVRDGGVRSARSHVEEEGGLAVAHTRAGGPGTSDVRSGGGSPGTTVPSRVRGWQGKGEKGESARVATSGPARRVGHSCREREKMGGRKIGQRAGLAQGGTRW